MKTFSVGVAALAAVLALLGVVGASAAPVVTQGDAVTHWNAIAVDTLTGLPGPAGGTPPAAVIDVAMVQVVARRLPRSASTHVNRLGIVAPRPHCGPFLAVSSS